MKASGLRSGDVLDLGTGPITVDRVIQVRHPLTDAPMWTVYRKPDGRIEATFYEEDDVNVITSSAAEEI